MTDLLAAVNQTLERDLPALWAALSPLGRRAVFPPDIPFQAAQARGRTYNATIGQITDGRGGALGLASLAAGLGGLGDEDRNRALLYSPVEGIAELRERWRAWQRRGVDAGVPSSLPIAAAGLTHALSIAADLFGGEGRAVVIPQPFWGNYRQTFTLRTGARVLPAPAFRDGRYQPTACAEALAALPAGEPAVVLLNIPSNPGGYAPTVEERAALRAALVEGAAARPLVVLCDDAYAGLVFEPGIPEASLFWELIGVHPNLVPVKLDGVTKELVFFGGRVGFVTFAVAPGTPAAEALESKTKCLIRAAIGSPVATSQVIALQALRHPEVAAQVAAIKELLARRYRLLQEALAASDPALLRVLPFNSGCFALVEIPEELGVTSEAVRQRLLAAHDTGLVSIAPRYLRIAFCSLAEEAIPELVRRLQRGISDLTGR